MATDLYLTGEGVESSGVDIRAYPEGLYIGGWYDNMVGIEGGFVTWAEIEALKKKGKRRRGYGGERREPELLMRTGDV